MEYILCAAIHYDNGKVYPNMKCYGIDTGFVICGYRHHNIIGILPTNPYYKTDTSHINDIYTRPKSDDKYVQGFVTSTGRFVNRSEAVNIAKSAGQISADFKNKNLYSEDLY